MSMIYSNLNLVLLRVRNHWMIIYNKVLDKSARLMHHPSTYKIPWSHIRILKDSCATPNKIAFQEL